MIMDTETLRLAASALNILFSLILALYIRLDRKDRATMQSIRELEDSVNKRFGDKCQRLSRLEGEIKSIPTREQFDREREIFNSEIVRVHERIDDLIRSAQQTNTMVAEAIGQLKQINERLK